MMPHFPGCIQASWGNNLSGRHIWDHQHPKETAQELHPTSYHRSLGVLNLIGNILFMWNILCWTAMGPTHRCSLHQFEQKELILCVGNGHLYTITHCNDQQKLQASEPNVEVRCGKFETDVTVLVFTLIFLMFFSFLNLRQMQKWQFLHPFLKMHLLPDATFF